MVLSIMLTVIGGVAFLIGIKRLLSHIKFKNRVSRLRREHLARLRDKNN